MDRRSFFGLLAALVPVTPSASKGGLAPVSAPAIRWDIVCHGDEAFVGDGCLLHYRRVVVAKYNRPAADVEILRRMSLPPPPHSEIVDVRVVQEVTPPPRPGECAGCIITQTTTYLAV